MALERIPAHPQRWRSCPYVRSFHDFGNQECCHYSSYGEVPYWSLCRVPNIGSM